MIARAKKTPESKSYIQGYVVYAEGKAHITGKIHDLDDTDVGYGFEEVVPGTLEYKIGDEWYSMEKLEKILICTHTYAKHSRTIQNGLMFEKVEYERCLFCLKEKR